MDRFFATAWNNGRYHASGAGYGLKFATSDRDTYFSREWEDIYLHLAGTEAPVRANIAKASFWNDTCREVISKEIGLWLISHRLAPWRVGHPPRLLMEPIGDRGFSVRPPAQP